MKHGDVTKLPKWAQSYISTLERSLDATKAKLAVGPPNSDTFVDHYPVRQPLGRGTQIRFQITEHEHIDVSLEKGILRVYASTPLSAQPVSSNVVMLKLDDWWGR